MNIDRISMEDAKSRIRKYVDFVDVDCNSLPCITTDKVQVLSCCYSSIGSVDVKWQVAIYDDYDNTLDRFNVV